MSQTETAVSKTCLLKVSLRHDVFVLFGGSGNRHLQKNFLSVLGQIGPFAMDKLVPLPRGKLVPFPWGKLVPFPWD